METQIIRLVYMYNYKVHLQKQSHSSAIPGECQIAITVSMNVKIT